MLREALEAPAGGEPLMPAVAALYGRTHRLTRWRTDWSSQTGASQLGILHGSNADVPAFRWYEKETGEVVVSNRPTSAAELQRRAVERTGDPGLLAHDGASRGNLFTGGARQVALVLSVSARRGKETRSRAGYFAYFSDPANATRTAVSFVAEVLREMVQSTHALLRRRSGRGWAAAGCTRSSAPSPRSSSGTWWWPPCSGTCSAAGRRSTPTWSATTRWRTTRDRAAGTPGRCCGGWTVRCG